MLSDTDTDSVCTTAGKGVVAQLNYHVIGDSLPLHRAAVQRLVRELLARLAAHVLGSSWLQVRWLESAAGNHVRMASRSRWNVLQTRMFAASVSKVQPLRGSMPDFEGWCPVAKK